MKMYGIMSVFLLCLATTTITCSQDGVDGTSEIDILATQQSTFSDPEGQAVLAPFANIVGNFASIVADPYNPVVVAPNLASIFVGILNMAMEAMKYGALLNDNDGDDLITYVRIRDLHKKLCALVKKNSRTKL